MAKIGFDKRAFASFLSLLIIGGLIFGGVKAVSQITNLRSHASPSTLPQAIEIVNVTDSSLTIFWQTQTPTTGYITYGDTTDLGKTKLDDRDRDSGQPQLYQNHIVTIDNLLPKTKYYYTIGVNDTNNDRNGYPYIFFTGTPIAQAVAAPSLTARILNADRTPANDTFVTLTFEDQASGLLSNTLGAITQADGTYTMQLANLRSADGTAGFSLSPNATYLVDVTMLSDIGKTYSQSIVYAAKNQFPVLYFGNDQSAAAPNSATTALLASPSASPHVIGTLPPAARNLLLPSGTTSPQPIQPSQPKATAPHTPGPKSLKLLQ